jgi:hypothetical protein
VDGLISSARDNHLHLVFVWFGSWKNGGSSYAPAWVKEDLTRFPRAQDQPGSNLETLSVFGNSTRDSDARAFAALMKHIRDVDGGNHTVLMMQVENEVGVLGPPRDRSVEADAAWNGRVPERLISYLLRSKELLGPELLGVWSESGFRKDGAWAEVFGNSQRSQEIFMAWQYSQYIDAVAAAGKAAYPIPMYVNAWLVQYPGEPGGEHPSGGPVSRVMDIWRAGAPHLDFFSPDIYLADFRAVLAGYGHMGNPLFVPEALGGSVGGSNALYAFSQGAFGFSPFAIDRITGDESLVHAYGTLRQLSPLLTTVDQTKIAGVVRQGEETKAAVEIGGYLLRIQYQQGQSVDGMPSAAIIVNTGPNEFFIAGQGLSVSFLPDSAGPRQVELLRVEDGFFADGKWVPGRRLNGDETDDGSVILRGGPPTIQRVRLYRRD